MLGRHASSSSSTSLMTLTTQATRCRRAAFNPCLLAVSPRHHSTSLRRQHTPADLSRKHANHHELGVRSRNPPDTLPDPEHNPPSELPDHEWELRTGRAIYVIQETLPQFFSTGLVTSVDKETGSPNLPSASLVPSVNTNFLEYYAPTSNEEPIYSPSIRFSYTPPVALPAPFPKTFHIDGIQLYAASAGFIRHTMNALYCDLSVDLTKFVINTPKQPIRPPSSSLSKRRLDRDKGVLVRQIITGKARVTGKPGEWEVESTYTFSPVTGLISQHTINAIHPAPHQAVYDSIRVSFGKLLGIEWEGRPPPQGVVCKGKLTGSSGP